ncbi:hypothetical protein [Asaia bogorensis]|uniref:hypothetical protein n=1 Tax=Asaia bogorensis TaxID=91915 RepID=UPI000706A3C9|nr:hypothetical protein [Asaia bogorensis]BAT19701.1 hypothetical protein Asbog_01428 [Asaia bogorensis NBRC 16594]
MDTEVSGNTHLTGGVISSTAEAERNHFSTGSLTAESLENISRWSGTSVSAGGGYSKGEAPSDVLKTGTFAVGHEDHSESSVTQSVITGNIDVQSGSTTGHYSTDLASANGHPDNDFDAKKLNTTLQIQTVGQTLAESAVEVGKQVYDKFQADRGVSGGSGRNISGNNATQGAGSHNSSDGQAQLTDGSGRTNTAAGDLAASSGGSPTGGAQASDSNSGHGAFQERPSEEITVRPPEKFWSDAQLTTQLEGYENWEVRGGRNKPYSGGMGSSAEAQAFWNASENRLSQISNLPEGWGLIGSLPLAGMQAMDGKGMAALGTLALAGPNLVGLGSQFRVVALGAGGLHAGAVSGGMGSGVLALVQGGRGVVTVGDIAKVLKSPLTQGEARNAFNTALKAYQAYQNVDATAGEHHHPSDQANSGSGAQTHSGQQSTPAETVGADSLSPNNDEPPRPEEKEDPGKKANEVGARREQIVAEKVGGRVSREIIKIILGVRISTFWRRMGISSPLAVQLKQKILAPLCECCAFIRRKLINGVYKRGSI